jgi:hypothetical protein
MKRCAVSNVMAGEMFCFGILCVIHAGILFRNSSYKQIQHKQKNWKRKTLFQNKNLGEKKNGKNF